ncbi:MAG: glycosyltransferase family 4 protein [Deltaproteobacteria bacterium]|nr:glycosyltransferase family 4 protein [Deltaproteobacteria bacterium]
MSLRVAHIAAADAALSQLLLNQLRHLREAGYRVAGISARGPHAGELDRAGIEFYEIPVKRTFGPLGDLRALIALYRVLRRERFDIIHTHTPKGGLLGQYAALLARVPLRVHTIHGLYFPGFMRPEQRWMYVWLERITLAFSHHNFSQNPEDIPVAIDERIVRADRLQHVGNGISLRRFDRARFSARDRTAIRAELGYGERDLVVGMVGRLVEEKGYREAFEAARIVASRVPEARFAFVGGFEQKADAIQPDALAAHGIDRVAQFLGHRDDVDRIYAALDVFMLPSHREGFPRALMEAAAMGLPCVATNVRGCRQTVDDGGNGLLVPARDAPALASALERLLRSPAERVRMGAAGRAKALAEFDEARVIDDILEAYDRLASERGLTEQRRGLLRRAIEVWDGIWT